MHYNNKTLAGQQSLRFNHPPARILSIPIDPTTNKP
jgi:hypothetical protein